MSEKVINPASSGSRAIWSLSRSRISAVVWATVPPPSNGAVVIVRAIVPSALVKVTETVSPATGPLGAAVATKKLSRLAVTPPVTPFEKFTWTLTGGDGVANPAVPAVRPLPRTNEAR